MSHRGLRVACFEYDASIMQAPNGVHYACRLSASSSTARPTSASSSFVSSGNALRIPATVGSGGTPSFACFWRLDSAVQMRGDAPPAASPESVRSCVVVQPSEPGSASCTASCAATSSSAVAAGCVCSGSGSASGFGLRLRLRLRLRLWFRLRLRLRLRGCC